MSNQTEPKTEFSKQQKEYILKTVGETWILMDKVVKNLKELLKLHGVEKK